MKTLLFSFMVILMICPALADTPKHHHANDVGQKIIINRILNVPLGTMVTVTGHKHKVGLYSNAFWIDAVNGKKVAKGMNVLIPGIEHWLDDQQAELRGFEQGVFTVKSSGNLAMKKQTLSLMFKAIQVISPAKLSLKNKKQG